MSEHKGNHTTKGIVLALVFCVAAVWVAGSFFLRSTHQVQEASLEETYADVVVGTITTEDVPVIATQPQTKSTAPAPAETTGPAAPEKRILKTMSPVEGAPIFGYSMEALSYNQTTRDWRVHNGIDLAAEAGSSVVAAADGEVYKVYEDEYLGHTVVIRHNDGYTTCYSSLAEGIPVKPGDKLAMGDTIGCAGDTAIVESAMGSHVHFSVTHYNEPMDPEAFLEMGK